MRTRAAVQQCLDAADLKPADPLARSSDGDAEGGCSRLPRESLFNHIPGQSLSTAKAQSGILMNVHSILRRFLVARHNQLLRFKSNGQPLERSQVPHLRDVLVLSLRWDRPQELSRGYVSSIQGRNAWLGTKMDLCR